MFEQTFKNIDDVLSYSGFVTTAPLRMPLPTLVVQTRFAKCSWVFRNTYMKHE
jgi:hypothetical protein